MQVESLAVDHTGEKKKKGKKRAMDAHVKLCFFNLHFWFEGQASHARY